MRLYGKLIVIFVIGAALHGSIQRYEAQIDDAQFAVRALVLYLQTGKADAPELMDAATALHERQMKRIEHRVAAAADSTNATTRPAWERDASDADGLDSSLAIATDACDAAPSRIVVRPAR